MASERRIEPENRLDYDRVRPLQRQGMSGVLVPGEVPFVRKG